VTPTAEMGTLAPPYRTIVADPPWPYSGAASGGFVIPKPSGDEWQRGVERTGYTLTSLADLAALPVKDLAESNAHLYCWATNAFVVEAHDLVRAWGFRPKTILTWVKVHHSDPCRVSMKTGYHFRGATEHVIFAVRGSLRLATTEGVPTAFLWPRVGQHSCKPPAFFDLVERVSPGPYLELFARAPRLGWDHWGHGYELSPNGRSES
jgi:N6-adenosine-specific RNA methylase IME4